MSTVHSTFMVDYCNNECFGNDSELQGKYLLIAMYYVHLLLSFDSIIIFKDQ